MVAQRAGWEAGAGEQGAAVQAGYGGVVVWGKRGPGWGGGGGGR